jgi:hypothetical protein
MGVLRAAPRASRIRAGRSLLECVGLSRAGPRPCCSAATAASTHHERRCDCAQPGFSPDAPRSPRLPPRSTDSHPPQPSSIARWTTAAPSSPRSPTQPAAKLLSGSRYAAVAPSPGRTCPSAPRSAQAARGLSPSWNGCWPDLGGLVTKESAAAIPSCRQMNDLSAGAELTEIEAIYRKRLGELRRVAAGDRGRAAERRAARRELPRTRQPIRSVSDASRSRGCLVPSSPAASRFRGTRRVSDRVEQSCCEREQRCGEQPLDDGAAKAKGHVGAELRPSDDANG